MKRQQRHELSGPALELLRDQRFLFRVGEKLAELGVVNERKNGLTLFLATLTKHLDKPVSVLVKGHTSSGKNNLVRAVLSLLPSEDIVRRSSLTPKALAYGQGALGRKILYVDEYHGAKDGQFLMRLLQSEGSVAHEHTVTGRKQRGTQIAERKGSPVIISTTTESRVYEDDETRFLSICADESEGQTRAVLRSKFFQMRSSTQQPGLEVWQMAVRILARRKVGFTYPEWFEFVADRIPASETRARRDADRFLSLLKIVSLLRSMSDSRRHKMATLEIDLADYAVAFEILQEGFSSTYCSVRPQALQVADTVRHLNKKRGRPVTIKEVAAARKWDGALTYKWLKSAVKNHLVSFEEGTRERNVKLLIPGKVRRTGFLPHPRLILRERTEIENEVRYFDPLSGNKVVLRRSGLVKREDRKHE